jgi:hypothetical protein
MRKTIKPILVTGSHRSGSTWAGKILSVAPHTAYIHEPFNIGIKNEVFSNPFKYWFQYVCDENSNHYEVAIDKRIHYKYPLGRNLTKVETVGDVARIIKNQVQFLLHKINNDTPIVKDPIALFSAEWLSETFDMNVLVMIRHPAAFCSSLKIKNWKFDFNEFLDQPLLMSRHLGKFEKEIREYVENEKDIIHQAILLWNCIHYTINIYQANYPKWLFVRHEDLSLDPVNQFQLIYEKFNLEFTRKCKSRILESSAAHNPVEQQAGNEYMRNSKENINNWKKRLSHNEIELIKARTLEVSNLFYAESEW